MQFDKHTQRNTTETRGEEEVHKDDFYHIVQYVEWIYID